MEDVFAVCGAFITFNRLAVPEEWLRGAQQANTDRHVLDTRLALICPSSAKSAQIAWHLEDFTVQQQPEEKAEAAEAQQQLQQQQQQQQQQ